MILLDLDKGCHSPRVAVSIPIGGKLFAEFILLFTTKQYKNARSANFVHDYLPVGNF